jgi:hypothetical protein
VAKGNGSFVVSFRMAEQNGPDSWAMHTESLPCGYDTKIGAIVRWFQSVCPRATRLTGLDLTECVDVNPPAKEPVEG